MVILLLLIVVGCMKSTDLAPVVNVWLQPDAKLSFYRVKSGDTIYSIAWAFGLDYRALAAVNNLNPLYSIRPGEVLRMTIIPRGKKIIPPTRLAAQTLFSRTPLKYWQPPHIARPVFSWHWPAQGRIIGRYSVRIIGNQGIDIAGQYGEPVRAAADGIVVYSGAGVRGYGNLIIVKHNESYLSAYAFNKRILVKEGRRVRPGQKIAEMGHTDAGCVMLHFEIRRDGKPVNPLRYLSWNEIIPKFH
ncbi:peptidase [Coxiella-like endosymbiont of Rhipicephalus sanguineus]|uniref:peptidoglycan DD-metalloendopeptidase family protein n=1 Tax=Coxiella-like endosymbiont of Rhipicephalus sanguineus TaxID=1955402 RepID=UPI00203DBFBA|nr:peptidoglycan DD-metalloendopeptidase family protein [Coxiella-like endosymbiont of Rhipicephalus sanguineus]MBT8506429.1 peptidase [Coxiella-like endosymbiont of Rhipicephalus sanguineus]